MLDNVIDGVLTSETGSTTWPPLSQHPGRCWAHTSVGFLQGACCYQGRTPLQRIARIEGSSCREPDLGL